MATNRERITALEAWRVGVEERLTELGKPEPDPDPDPDPGPPPLPDANSTGPRVPLKTSPTITTTADGQVIEGLDVATRIRIQHSNVVVRDCRVRADSPTAGVYPIHVRKNPTTGVVPTNVLIEYVEIAGQPGVNLGPPAVYSAEGNWTLRHADIHDVGSGPRLTSNCRIESSWMHNTPTTDPAEHKSGIGCNGGAHNAVVGCVIECSASGCSGALCLYGDFAQIDDILVEGNLFNTAGSYGMYGGSLPSKPFPHARGVRVLNNRFGRKFHPKCGIYGPVAHFNPAEPGNEWAGNVWDDTGQPLEV